MSDSNNIQGDITLDFDNAEKARERRKRRSTIFEKSQNLANTAALDNSNAMEVDNSDKDWEERYLEQVKKEIDGWKCASKSVKNECDALIKKIKNAELPTNLEPSELLSDTEKEFLKGSKIYRTYIEKIDSTVESFAIVEKLQQMIDNRISRSVGRLESKFSTNLEKLWLSAKNDDSHNYPISATEESENADNLPYSEPFLQDFSCV